MGRRGCNQGVACTGARCYRQPAGRGTSTRSFPEDAGPTPVKRATVYPALALRVLGVETEVLDFDGQRFLEIPRFDRVGPLGCIGVFSLRALDAEVARITSRRPTIFCLWDSLHALIHYAVTLTRPDHVSLAWDKKRVQPYRSPR